jgi:hypothetical protein
MSSNEYGARSLPFRAQLILRNPDGSTEGRDPSELPKELLERAYEPAPLLRVIRDKCFWCSNGSVGEIRACTAVGCPLWPYRLGKNPFTRRKGNSRSLPKHSPEARNSQRPILAHPDDTKSTFAEKPSPKARESVAAAADCDEPAKPMKQTQAEGPKGPGLEGRLEEPEFQ